jgi:hypothetical protein
MCSQESPTPSLMRMTWHGSMAVLTPVSTLRMVEVVLTSASRLVILLLSVTSVDNFQVNAYFHTHMQYAYINTLGKIGI